MANMVYLKGKPLRLSPAMVIGQGGEAVIYKVEKAEVLKLYMAPSDPVYSGDPQAQEGARQRLEEHQRKLPAFPKNLPPNVVTPIALAYDQASNGRVAGYTMSYLEGMEVLLSYGDHKFREQNQIDANQVVKILQNLHDLVSKVHNPGVVIGDFNDLNVLVDGSDSVFLVDADSMQFGPFLCKTFTARFVDPLLCRTDELVLRRPHNELSDWYAFSTMAFQSLLFINPYFGGVHKPKNAKQLRNNARVLQRISVFSSDVIYPKSAVPLSALSDEILDYFQKVYEKDERREFPLHLLQDMRWTTCSSCGTSHARNICPVCAQPGAVKETVTIRGTVKATRVFRTSGQILFAAYQNGEVRYVYHESGTYRREGGETVLSGPLDGSLRLRIWGDKTVLAKGSSLMALSPDHSKSQLETEMVGRLPVLDANRHHLYWVDHGRLVYDGTLAPSEIGTVLPNQTLIWVGSRFGLGFYRAGSLARCLVFDIERRGINDAVPVPPIRGNLIDATCAFSDELVWFMLSISENGVMKNLCFVINDRAELLAQAEALQDDDSWLGDGIRGRMALGHALYAATDSGIIRAVISSGHIDIDREFPDTEPFVNASTQLLPGKGGITAVSSSEVVLLEI